MKDLDSYIKQNMKFLTIEDGESVQLIYKGYSIIPDRFKGGETISYLFQYPDSEKTISWNKGSSRIAREMKKMAPGDLLQITRNGVGFETKYRIVSMGNKVTPPIENNDEPIPF